MIPRLALTTALLTCALGCGGAASDEEQEALSAAHFGGRFAPAHAPYGGFGGAAGCTVSRTPVIFLHGNTESAADWLRPDSKGGPSVPARFLAAGWRECELFAVTWLPAKGREQRQLHFHDEAKADLVAGFVRDVLAYTGAAQVDLIGHSMGVTVGMHALDRGALWGRVRRLVAIAGGLRGLDSCIPWGPANPVVPTCGGQNLADSEIFGFYPYFNQRMEAGGFRALPSRHPAVVFASLHAGRSDEILCPSCGTALFDPAPNVRAQLDVGSGSPREGNHDDTSGVGHFRARRDTAALQLNLLGSSCSGKLCCDGYPGRCAE